MLSGVLKCAVIGLCVLWWLLLLLLILVLVSLPGLVRFVAHVLLWGWSQFDRQRHPIRAVSCHNLSCNLCKCTTITNEYPLRTASLSSTFTHLAFGARTAATGQQTIKRFATLQVILLSNSRSFRCKETGGQTHEA